MKLSEVELSLGVEKECRPAKNHFPPRPVVGEGETSSVAPPQLPFAVVVLCCVVLCCVELCCVVCCVVLCCVLCVVLCFVVLCCSVVWVLTRFLVVLGLSWEPFGASWGVFWGSWGHLRRS